MFYYKIFSFATFNGDNAFEISIGFFLGSLCGDSTFKNGSKIFTVLDITLESIQKATTKYTQVNYYCLNAIT